MNRFTLAPLILFTLFASAASAQTITGSGTVTLTWQRPTQYVNGDPLPPSQIEKYRIYWGFESRDYTDFIEVQNGFVQSREVELTLTQPVTTAYFAVTAWARGLESDYSNEASKTFTLEFEDVPPEAPVIVTITADFTCEAGESGRECRVTIE